MSDDSIVRSEPALSRSSFLCPECGSEASGRRVYRDPAMADGGARLLGSPWEAILQVCVCHDCGSSVPAHLAECWNGISRSEARRKWSEDFRAQCNDRSDAVGDARPEPKATTDRLQKFICDCDDYHSRIKSLIKESELLKRKRKALMHRGRKAGLRSFPLNRELAKAEVKVWRPGRLGKPVLKALKIGAFRVDRPGGSAKPKKRT